MKKEVYIGLGGNIGDTHTVFKQALQQISEIPEVFNLSVSRFYRTKPISDIPQGDYLNAVCRFQTNLEAKNLLQYLQAIETRLGKKSKAKNEPRIIDLDILLFGVELHQNKDLEIPHPHWHKRLFVLIPMAELVTEIKVPTIDGIKVYNVIQMITQLLPSIN